MIIDKKGKLFGKINVIDFCVLLFVVLAVAVCVFKFALAPSGKASKKAGDKANVVAEYTLKISGIRDYTVNQFKKGDKIYSTSDEENIGRIKDIKVTEAEGMILKADGTYKETTWPERYDVILTIESKGVINKKGFLVVGKEEQILSNKELTVTNRNFKTTSTIMDINVLHEEKITKDKTQK